MATLKQLKIFLAVAESLQMSEAARCLYISQPTVSQTISELEREFDTALFHREPKYLRLTPAGKRLAEQARLMEEGYARLESAMREEPQKRTLRIGATLTIGNTMIAQVIRNLKTEYPDISPVVYVENTRNLEEKILHNQVDIALIEGVVVSDKIAKLPLVEDTLELICAKDHPFWGRDEIRAEELRGQDFILREQGSGTRSLFENYMHTASVPLNVVGESASSTAIIEMVIQNLGVSVLSRRCVKRYTSGSLIHACTIRDMPMNRYFYICYHTNRPVTSQMTDFIRVAKESI